MDSLEHIKAGDRCIIQYHSYGKKPSPSKVVTVTRTTPKRILVGTYYYERSDGRSIPSGSGRIERTATAQECADWDREQAQERKQQAERVREQEAHVARRKELSSLFSALSGHVESADIEGHWHVVFESLTEDQVRNLRNKL